MNSPGYDLDDRVEKQQPLQQSNLIFFFNPDGQVLLYKKVSSKTNFDIALSKRNGLGGKKKEDETITASAKREIKDEGQIEIDESQLQEAGVIRFYFKTKKQYNQECHIYFVKDFTGEYGESDEMKQPMRFNPDNLPTDQMWESDKIWMPKILSWEQLKAVVYHDDDGTVLKYKEVKSFDEIDESFFIV